MRKVMSWFMKAAVFSALILSLFVNVAQARSMAPAVADTNTASVNGGEVVWQQGESPVIEVVFVLDTTGSMSGLIEGAKQKIWSIATDIIQAKQTPIIRMGLVGYRDRGDQYVTQLVELTEDLDSVYNALMKFQAAGGGDGPESVNQALYEGVHLMPWSNDPRALQIVFLVGDYPPHMDYQNDVPYQITGKTANQKGIIINTIQCGNHRPTAQTWQEIASMAQGQYVALSQTGNMQAISTPYDDQINRLSNQQAQTVLNYGSVEEKRDFNLKQQNRTNAPAAAQADRAELSYRGGDNVKLYTGVNDLVDDVKSGRVDISTVETEQLPDNMQAMSDTERAAYVENNYQERQLMSAKLEKLLEQRRAYLSAEQSRLAAENEGDAFDAKVAEMVREQAANKGIAY